MTVTWQEETVTGPLLIYHSEIPDAVNDSNGLICSHQTRTGIAWHLTRGAPLVNSGGTFNNIITNGGRQAQIMRGTHDGGDETGFDGLWTCRLNGATGTEAFHVGIYDDTPTTSKIYLLFPFQVDFPQIIVDIFFCLYYLNIIIIITNDHETEVQFTTSSPKVFVFDPTTELSNTTT